MGYKCAQCSKAVPGTWVEPGEELKKVGRIPRWEPVSRYWKSSGINEITEAYCSAECSLRKHENDSQA